MLLVLQVSALTLDTDINISIKFTAKRSSAIASSSLEVEANAGPNASTTMRIYVQRTTGTKVDAHGDTNSRASFFWYVAGVAARLLMGISSHY